MQRTFSTSFVFDFQGGDNLAYNCRVLGALLEAKENLGDIPGGWLNKPIILICASVIEFCLCEIFCRARFNTREGVPSLTHKQITGLRKTSRDEFALYIKVCKQNKILGREQRIYDVIDKLREARNRIHIQNTSKSRPIREGDLFTEHLVECGKWSLEFVLCYLSINYPRAHDFTLDVTLPFDFGIQV